MLKAFVKLHIYTLRKFSLNHRRDIKLIVSYESPSDFTIRIGLLQSYSYFIFASHSQSSLLRYILFGIKRWNILNFGSMILVGLKHTCSWTDLKSLTKANLFNCKIDCKSPGLWLNKPLIITTTQLPRVCPLITHLLL